MKSIEGRIDRLEERTRGRDGDLVLVDAKGNVVEAWILQKPTAKIEGIAVLPDGSEMPIANDAQCGDMVHFIPLQPRTVAEWGEQAEPIETDLLEEDKLYLRRSPVVVFEGVEPGFFAAGNQVA
jgi:hypothetical protein